MSKMFKVKKGLSFRAKMRDISLRYSSFGSYRKEAQVREVHRQSAA